MSRKYLEIVKRELLESGVVADLRSTGMSNQEIADALNESGRLGKGWTLKRIEAVMRKYDDIEAA